MSTAAQATPAPSRRYHVDIQAAPQAIWDAITKPEWTKQVRLIAPLVE